MEIQNFINGKFCVSTNRKQIQNYKGDNSATIYSASSSQLRIFKRNLFRTLDQISKIPLEKIITLIQLATKKYCNSVDTKFISKMSGTPISLIKESMQHRVNFSKSIEKLLLNCFGHKQYDLIPIKSSKGHRLYSSKGPIICIMPGNSEETLYYLIVQALVTRSPIIVKSSSKGSSSYSAIAFIESLLETANSMNDTSLLDLINSVAVINLLDKNFEEIIDSLEVDNAVYVIFGSEETVQKFGFHIKNPRKIIRMGTGLSATVLLDDADVKSATYDICHSASFNNGLDCLGTKLVYVHQDLISKFMQEIHIIADEFQASDPLHNGAKIGNIPNKHIEYIHSKLTLLDKHTRIKINRYGMSLSYVELDEHEHFEEFPGPIFGIRVFKENFMDLFSKDLKKNELRKNLVTSIYTSNINKFYELSQTLPSYTVKFNKPSTEMNIYLEHHGRYLIKDFLDVKLVEE